MGIEDKEKKPYQPTEEDMQKAEEMMTEEEKEMSKIREEGYKLGYQAGLKAGLHYNESKEAKDWTATQNARSRDARRRGDPRA